MARGYIPVGRDQLFLLPPNLREWLPEGHLVWLVLDVVKRVDTAGLHARHRLGGVGRRAYDPDMLLALLIYAYCTGQRSSRQIERLCEVDVAFRVVCANQVPDHTTIARFRQVFAEVAAKLFADVLEMCVTAGVVRVGVVALDGTKIAADASLKRNRTRQQLEAEVAKMMAEAEQIDAEEDDRFGGRRGDELPDDLADRRSRETRLDEALAELKRREQARHSEAERVRDAYQQRQRRARAEGHRGPRGRAPNVVDRVAEAQADLDRELERLAQCRAEWKTRWVAQGRRPRGRGPTTGGHRVQRARDRLANAQAAAARQPKRRRGGNDERVNVTDVDSRMMPTQGGGWVQGYNAQAVVTQDGVVVAADVTQHVADSVVFEPMTNATQTNLAKAGISEPVGTLLADAGYWSNHNATVEGPDRLIATTKSHKQRQALRDKGPTHGPPPHGATPAQAMEHRLRTVDGQALYKQRQHTVEPVFGQIKHGRGIRRFTQRGLDAVRGEWQLITTTHNILKLHRTATT